MKRLRLLGWIAVILGLSIAQAHSALDPTAGSQDVQIVVNGQRYKSIKEYHRQVIKEQLIEALATRSLGLFDNLELLEIIQEVRFEKLNGKEELKLDEPVEWMTETLEIDELDEPGNDDLTVDSAELQAMLDEYLKTHKDVDTITIDPDKVKSITIPSKPSQ